ncbi:MAG: hypothetical protein B2I17_00050 [Thermoplasmatales archaeon B_DKE]|nr:MAG: hypothetical protein B2I17_00050 [Thermoplasmatales archaeon B_DKE]
MFFLSQKPPENWCFTYIGRGQVLRAQKRNLRWTSDRHVYLEKFRSQYYECISLLKLIRLALIFKKGYNAIEFNRKRENFHKCSVSNDFIRSGFYPKEIFYKPVFSLSAV